MSKKRWLSIGCFLIAILGISFLGFLFHWQCVINKHFIDTLIFAVGGLATGMGLALVVILVFMGIKCGFKYWGQS